MNLFQTLNEASSFSNMHAKRFGSLNVSFQSEYKEQNAEYKISSQLGLHDSYLQL